MAGNAKKVGKRSPTIKDIAKLVGVHHSTVSRVLNPNSNSPISPKVAKKINDAAESLGYYPNLAASSLKQNRSFALGLLIPSLVNPLFPSIIRGIQDTADQSNFSLITANTDDDEKKEMKALDMMRSRALDGIIIATARREDRIVQTCIEQDIPFVLINRTIDGEGASAVLIDEEFAMQSSIDHLYGLGHRRIAHVSGPLFSSTGHERSEAFKRQMELNNLDGSLLEEARGFTIDDGYNAFKRLHARDKSFTAVVVCSDMCALGCMDAMQEMGLSAPDDISLVGNNDIPFLSRMKPTLTTISVPKYEMGEKAVNILLGQIDGALNGCKVLRLQPRLVVRDSTGPAVSRHSPSPQG